MASNIKIAGGAVSAKLSDKSNQKKLKKNLF